MTQCEKCSNPIKEGDAFCTNCGASITPQPENNSVKTGKKSNGKIIAMAVVSAICVAFGIVGVVLALNSNNDSNNKESSNYAVSNKEEEAPNYVVLDNESSNSDQIAINDSNNIGGSTGNTATSSETKITIFGYDFVIPKGYQYEIDIEGGEETLMISDDITNYTAGISYEDSYTFAEVSNNKDSLGDALAEGFNTPVTVGTTTIDNSEYIYFHMDDVEGMNVLYVVSPADLYCFGTFIVTDTGVDGTSYLENVAKVIGSAQKKKNMSKLINGRDSINIKKFNISHLLNK